MSSKKEELPPGVKLENTYLHYNKPKPYNVPNISEAKQPEAKKTKPIDTGFEEHTIEISLKVTNNSILNPKDGAPKKTSHSTGFPFIKTKTTAPAVQPPKKDEYLLDSTLEH